MKLFKISQNINNDYDTYSDAEIGEAHNNCPHTNGVVCASFHGRYNVPT